MSLFQHPVMSQLEHVDPCGPQRSTHLVYTSQAISGPSHHDPHPDAALDRWTSLVEVCASTSPTSLNALIPASRGPSSPHPISAHLPVRLVHSLAPMVQAPLSDIEDETIAPFDDNDSSTRPRIRKRHACELCDKAFDRPSTLKTHLLVHTGITPFSCHLCGRRFGVQSNCNRHIRRCAIREELFIARRFEFEALQSKKYDDFTEIQQFGQAKRSNSRSLSPPITSKPKRARRKRSPSATWIPHSLTSFTISTTCPPAPLPLPPVRPRVAHEERDSYISYHDQPYTEEGWSGRLPGPAPLFEHSHGYSGVMKRRYTSKN